MELELGLKITKTKDDIGSISEYQFMKDAGPVFHSRETNTMFILTANLKGYKRNNIDIKISKDGSKISINGKKPIQEMVMMGWVMQRKVVDVKGFNKVFKIPHGVNLDKIKANYNEEEWMMNIVMPKLVKGICGLKIEEFKEQYFDKGKSHLEKSETDHVSSSVGETSQKGTKDFEFQQMGGSENVIEKMFDDDTNNKFNKETIQREVGESKKRIEDENGEIRYGIDDVKEKEISSLRIEDSKVKDIGEKDGKERHEALKTLEDMEKMLNKTNKDNNEKTIEEEVGDSKLRIENGESAREKGGKDEYELTKKSERDQGFGVSISNKFEDTRKDKEFEAQKIDISSAKKRHGDVNRDIIGGTIKEKEEKVESNLMSEDSNLKGISQNIVDTSQNVFEESMIQQSGESKQKESKQHLKESETKNSMEPFEAMKVLEVEQNVVGHISSNIGCVNQNEFEESRIPQRQNTKSTKGEMNGGEYEKFHFEANRDFQEEMIKPKMKTKDGDQECVLEKLGGKEEFDDGRVIIKKEFPKQLPRSSSKESGGSNVEKMQETKNVKEEMVNKEVECFMDKGEGERIERMHVEEKKVNNTRETMQEEIEESGKGIKENRQEQFAGVEGRKEFNFENKDEQNEVIKEALVKNESLIVEGGEYKEKTKEIVQDEEDKNKHGILKLKGEGSTKIHGEPIEPFEKENLNNGIFDGRKTQKFQEIEQIEVEDGNEEGVNIEKPINKVTRDKYEKVQNEENEGFHKNIPKKKCERFLQEETNKGISKASNVAKVFPKKMLDSSVDTKEGRNNTSIEKTKVIKESSMEPFEAMKVSKLKPFEANDDDHKDFIEPKRETKDEEPNGNNSNKEGFDGKITISEKFSKNVLKSSHEESEGLNVLKMQETKDVKENMVKGKGREIEYFKKKDEGDHVHGKIGCTNQNEFREPRVPQMKKTKITKEKKNGGMNSENTPFEVNEDVQKTMFGDAVQKEVVKTNEEFPKRSFNETEGLNVQKIQESKNVKEKMVDREIEYFEEKGEGERFKSMYVETKKGNTRQTMQEEIEKSNNEIKESGQQHAKENTTKEMDEVSKNVTGELKPEVAEINESKGFNVAKEEEQKEVTKKEMVESESLMEKVEGKESKERAKAKRVQDEDDKIEFGMVKLKGEGPTKIHADGRSFQEEESKYVNEKGEKIKTFGKKVDDKIQNEEDEDFKKGLTKEKDEHYLPDDSSERRSLDTKDVKEGFSMKMLDSQIDTREELKDRMVEKMKGLKENEKIVPFVKKVKLQEEEIKERTKAIIVQDEEDKIEYGIVKLKGEGSTKITHKFQEKEEIEEEISKGRSKASKAANEPFEDKIEKENSNKKLDPIDELFEKENVDIGIFDGRKILKFQEMNQTQDAKEKGANSEKTMKKMNRNKVSEKVEQVAANEGLRNDIEEQNFGESMTKEELQEFEMERIRTPEREFQSVVSMGFKEFDYENAKDKKLKTKVLDTKFESKERYVTKDESMNQEVSSPRKSKEVGENRTRNKVSMDEFETKEHQVVKPISVPRFQSEVEEKDIKNLIEMKKEEKKEGEFHNGEEVGEIILEKTDEPEKKINYRKQENAARDFGKVETKEKNMLKEYKTTQNVNDEKCKIDRKIAKSGIEKVDKKKSFHETTETTQKKERSVKFEADEKEEESSDETLKNDVAEMKTKRDYEQLEYGVEEVNAPKTAAYVGAKQSEYVIEEHEATKEFSPKNVEKGKVVKKREGLIKVADSEETKDDSTLTTTQIIEEKKPKMKEKTSQFDKASGSKRVAEKVHETLKREHQNKSEESTKHELTIAPNMTNEIPKVEKLQEEKEGERNILALEATISKEDAAQAKATHAEEKVAQQSKVPSSLSTQQLQVEEEEKTNKKEDEQCINKEQEIEEEKDYEKVYEEQKEDKDETCGGKKDSEKISKKLLVPLVIAGSALLASIVFIFVRHRRSRKM